MRTEITLDELKEILSKFRCIKITGEEVIEKIEKYLESNPIRVIKSIKSDFNDESMGIDEKEGTRITLIHKDCKLINGRESDRQYASEYLEIGDLYTVNYIDVDRWSSGVYLKEVPGRCFNTVMFKVVKDDRNR